MKLREDSERVTMSLVEAVTLLCKTGFSFHTKLHIDGLLGITLDDDEVHLVKIQEVIKAVSEDVTNEKTHRSPSRFSLFGGETEEVINLCVKSNVSDNAQDTQNSNDAKIYHTNCSVSNKRTVDTELERDQVEAECRESTEKSDKENLELKIKPKKRSRKGKVTRHVIQPNSEAIEQDDDFPQSNVNVNSNSQDTSCITAFADENSCNSFQDGPVNLTQETNSSVYNNSNAILIKHEPDESQNYNYNQPSQMNSANVACMNLLNNINISAAPLLNSNSSIGFNTSDLETQWLQNIAQVVKAQQQSPLVIAPATTLVTASNTQEAALSAITKQGRALVPIAPAPSDLKATPGGLGMHRYSPYVVPPVMGPITTTTIASAIVLNTPYFGKLKNQKPPNAVVNNTGTAVPVKPNNKNAQNIESTCVPVSFGNFVQIAAKENPRANDWVHNSSFPPNSVFSCANCGCTKTTTWRRNALGEHVCNPCGLYYRLYKNARGGLVSGGGTTGLGSPKSTRNGNTSSNSLSLSGNKNASTHICTNCGTLVTTMWRRNIEGEPVCNACGLYFKLHKVNRPLHMAKTEIHSRRRKPKSPSVVNWSEASPNPSLNESSLENPLDLRSSTPPNLLSGMPNANGENVVGTGLLEAGDSDNMDSN